MQYLYSIIIGYFSIFAVIIGLVRFRKILESYRLFVVFLCVALFNDILSNISVELWHTNAVNGNIYVYTESIILLFLFYKWGSFGKKILYFLICLLSVVWIGENLIFSSLRMINSGFRLFYALVIVILSIDQINITMLHERKNLFKNAKFLICVLFAFYYTFRATYEVFYIVPLKLSESFVNSLYDIFVFVNLFTNLGYALAALWIPTKQKFTLPY